MAEAKMIQNLHGYFDVKEYSTKPREQRATKGNDQTITFGTKFNDMPEQFKDFARAFTDKNGNQAYFVEFKIGANCKWFDSKATQTLRPDNTYLDGKQFEVSIQYVQLNGDASKMQARGYWANAVMFKEVESNPFAAFVPETQTAAPTHQEEAPATPQEAAPAPQTATPTPAPTAPAAPAAAPVPANAMGDDEELPF